MNPVRGIETIWLQWQSHLLLFSFKLMNPVRGIETIFLLHNENAAIATFKLMNPVRGIETKVQYKQRSQ